MGVATTTISTRPNAAPTTAQSISTINNTINAFIEAGMIPVSHSDFSGQSETYVAVATGAEHEAVIPSLGNGRLLIGYRVFRHPFKNYYIKVDFSYEADGNTVAPSNATRIAIIFTLGLGLNGTGGFSGIPVILTVKNNIYAYQSAYMANNTFGKSLTLRVSVGENHFTCCASFDFYGYYGNYDYCNRETGYSTVALAIIGSKKDPRYSVVMIPRQGTWSSQNFDEMAQTSLTEANMNLQRKWLIDHQSQSSIYLSAGQSLGTMSEVGLVSDINGVRVSQAYITVNGELLPLEMGCIHAGASNDMGVLNVNLDGNGAKDFYTPFGLGTCNFVAKDVPLSRIPVLMLPYW